MLEKVIGQIPFVVVVGFGVAVLICFGIGFVYYFSIQEFMQKADLVEGEIINVKREDKGPFVRMQRRMLYHIVVRYTDNEGQVRAIKSANGKRDSEVGQTIKVYSDPTGKHKPMVNTFFELWRVPIQWFILGSSLILGIIYIVIREMLRSM